MRHVVAPCGPEVILLIAGSYLRAGRLMFATPLVYDATASATTQRELGWEKTEKGEVPCVPHTKSE